MTPSSRADLERIRLPTLRRAVTVSLIVGAAVIGAIAAAIVVGAEPEHQFVVEFGGITLLSAFALLTGAALSLSSYARRRLGTPQRWVWLVLGVGLVALAADELFQFHERVGRAMADSASAGPFRSWDDIIVIGYGVLAVGLVALMLPGLAHTPMVLRLLGAGFVCYALHTLVDSLAEPRTSLSAIVEESFKLASVTFLALAAYAGYLAVKDHSRWSTSADASPV